MSSQEGGETDLSIQSRYDSEEIEDSSDEQVAYVSPDKNIVYDDEEMFTGAKGLIKIVVQYISCVSSQHGHLTDMLKSVHALPKLSSFKDIDMIRYFLQELVSAGEELKVFFEVPIPNQLLQAVSNNQAVAAFINFLLLMIEVILRHFRKDFVACVKGGIKILRKELGFLITFLGDTGMHLQPEPTKNMVMAIQVLVNEVGSFLYSFFFTFIVFILITEDNYAMPPRMEAVVDEVRSFLHSNFSPFSRIYHRKSPRVYLKKKRKNQKKIKRKAIMDIKALVHEVGSFLDFIIFPENDPPMPGIGILDLALPYLLVTFDFLKRKIKEHCITVSKMMPSVIITPKNAVVSLFIVDSVLDDLMDLINNNKSGKIVHLNDQMGSLHEELKLLGSSISNIILQQHEEDDHGELVIRTRDIAYEVEYVINSSPPVWYLTLRLPQLLQKIQLIRKAIQEPAEKKIDASGKPAEVAKQVSPILEDIVVGFKKVETEIVEQLVTGMKQLQTITISGMPGLGKTTLAKKLYNHPTVGRHFDVRAWCVASQTYAKRNMLIEILMSMGNLKRESFTDMDDADLAQKLYQTLRGRRYLVVIDDIWDTNAWNELEKYFPSEHVGSRILFTTRHKDVVSPSFMKELPFLSNNESWELLQRKLFQKDCCPQVLLETGKQIARSCHGLPLAVVAIAGVLTNMEKKEHLWRKVATNLASHISENSNDCIQILELSYMHLPMHLKPCFLYFGAFKEDEEIPVRKLTSLWIAEGYIKKEEHKHIDEVALEYLMELIDRSLVLVAHRRSDGQVKTCKIHDLLREMCLRIADEKHFLKVVTFNDNDPAQFFSHHHRLIINNRGSHVNSLPFGLHVRSLLCVYLGSTAFNSRSFNVLRVLDFETRWVHPVIGIEHLVHLRYLAISRELPTMQNFHKLEFLDMNNVYAVEIPEILLNLASLRRMYFKGSAYFGESCRWKATKNKSFQINSNLQSISALSIRDKRDEKFLRCLRSLRRLTVWFESSKKIYFEVFNHLESLKLINVGDSSTRLISLPLYLKQLTLVDVHISSEETEIIGRLRSLEVLKLVVVSFERRHWDTSESEFPQLKFLKLCSLNLAKWNASSDNFPTLEHLVLTDCKKLKMIPSSFVDIPTLQKIELYGCSKAVKKSAKQIQEEQLDMGNEELKVIISDMGSKEQK